MGQLDFQFVDAEGSPCCPFPFEIAEEIIEEIEEESDGDREPPLVREAMKQIRYERDLSAAFYCFKGIRECFKDERMFFHDGGSRAA